MPDLSFEQWFSLAASAATVLAAFAAVVAVVIAARSLNVWRDQLRAATRYRAALRAYTRVGRFRDRMRFARDPFSVVVPLLEGEDLDSPPLIERERDKHRENLRGAMRAKLALEAMRSEVELHWQAEGTAYIDDLIERGTALRAASEAHYYHRLKAARRLPGFEQYQRAAEATRADVFDLSHQTGSDAFGQKTEGVVIAALAFFKQASEL